MSLALRDSPLVADATRERIKEHARVIGYIYNRRAARALLDRLNGVKIHGGQELIRPELHVRQSTGKPVER